VYFSIEKGLWSSKHSLTCGITKLFQDKQSNREVGQGLLFVVCDGHT